ncbi:MAG: 4-hydroxybenzoate 3-monooxygenase [Acidimicrobiia bacterium]
MTELPQRTQVAIIGGGPAGSLLAYLLHLEGIDSVVLELRSKDYVLGRVRAGVIEHGSGEILRDVGLGDRMDREGLIHDGVNLAFGGKLLRVDLKALVGKHVIVYGQTQLQNDLYDALEREAIPLIDEAENTQLHDIDTGSPRVTFERHGERHEIQCDYIAGCDGVRGATRDYVPEARRREFERLYPFVWIGVLSPTPPVSDEIIYANHPDGFALCSMRSEELSRYYVQGSADDTVADWPDERFWEALKTRLPDSPAERLVTGDTIETIVTPLRSWVMEPMSHGRLYLAGDAAHIVPPTGAKGLNLAISDVVYLARAFAEAYSSGSPERLAGYSETALARVWKAVRFSWWMTQTMHRFPGMSDAFDVRLQQAELDYVFESENARRTLAENYVGPPL